MKRSRPSNDLLSHSTNKKSSKSLYKCVICSLSFNSETQWKGHIKGKKHKNKEKLSLIQIKNETLSDNSDSEDYNELRKNKVPIKKNKNRKRKTIEKKHKIDDSLSNNTKQSNTNTILSRISCPFLSNYCLIQHSCNIQNNNSSLICSKCNLDLKTCKLYVSIINAHIKLVNVSTKSKFINHKMKIDLFIQLFIFILDLRITITCINNYKWSISIYTIIQQVIEQLYSLTKSIPFHSCENFTLKKISSIIESIDNIINKSNKNNIRDWEDIIRLSCFIDDIYYNLYYCWSTVLSGYLQYIQESIYGCIFNPLEYFQYLDKIYTKITKKDSNNILLEYWKSIVILSNTDILDIKSNLYNGNNILLKIYLLRYTETIRLFPIINNTLPQIKNKKHLQAKEHLCSDIMKLWRDSCRDWICHLYAYAIPNKIAISYLSSNIFNKSSLIEIGAGTGYWGSLIIKTINNKIYLYDCKPLRQGPQPEESKKAKKLKSNLNEYHGKAIAFTNILKGSITELKILSQQDLNSILILCYPPPKSSMALDCINNFNGKYIIYIGEWQGDTGTFDFEETLLNSYNLLQSIGLPNWSNTCYNMSIWYHKEIHIEQDNTNTIITSPNTLSYILNHGHIPLTCSNCNRNNRLKRCSFCYQVSYCSENCCSNHSVIHEKLHKFYFIHYNILPKWKNILHYHKIKSYNLK